jgi:uncharacterized protein YeaO (DUF488 family)
VAVKLKRAFDHPSTDDGERYLVERLWPRGISKADLALTAWLKEVAPSTELRKWFGHKAELWPEFARRYQAELAAPEKQAVLRDLVQKAKAGNITLVFATKMTELSGAAVLRDVLTNLATSSGLNAEKD